MDGVVKSLVKGDQSDVSVNQQSIRALSHSIVGHRPSSFSKVVVRIFVSGHSNLNLRSTLVQEVSQTRNTEVSNRIFGGPLIH